MKLQNHAKYILFVFLISSISLMSINFVFKNNDNKVIEDKESKVIIEAPKKSIIQGSKEIEEDGGIRVEIPLTEGNAESPVQPLPIPSSDFPVEVIPLS